MHQESTGQNSVTLLWQEPDQPNGIILEYEIKYYEKVTLLFPRDPLCQPALHQGLLWHTLWSLS